MIAAPCRPVKESETMPPTGPADEPTGGCIGGHETRRAIWYIHRCVVSRPGPTARGTVSGTRRRGLRLGMTEQDEQQVRMELSRLRQEHRDLDAAIGAMVALGTSDSIQVQRLKKRKLVLKDRISFLEDQILPDIIA
jgi:hypothetical protein